MRNYPDPETRSFSLFQDSISLQYSAQFGDGSGSDLCGPQSYQIMQIISTGDLIESPSWVSLDSGELSFSVYPGIDVSNGEYDFRFFVELDSYGIQETMDFKVIVDECFITGMETYDPPTLRDFQYFIYETAENLIMPKFSVTLSPQHCAFHGVVLEWSVNGDASLPSFATSVE
jgi:hypothetical protein